MIAPLPQLVWEDEMVKLIGESRLGAQQRASQQQSNFLAIAQQQAANHQACNQQLSNQRAQSGRQTGLGGLGGSAPGALQQLGQAASQNFHRSLQEGIQEVFTAGNKESYDFGWSDSRGWTISSSTDEEEDPYHTSLIDRLLYYKSKLMLSIGERIIDYCGD